MKFLDRSTRIFVYGQAVDMRKGFAGLEGLIRQGLGEDPLSGDVFVFVNRLKTMVKCFLWDRTGYVILFKRLERGRFQLQNPGRKVELDERRLGLLFDGIAVGGISRDG